MSAMEEYKDLLQLGYTFEKLNMKANSIKLYQKYVHAVSQVDYGNIVDIFYGYGAIEVMEISSMDEAIDKAYLIEKLKKLYSMVSNFRTDWNLGANVVPATNEALMRFFRWVDNDKSLTNDDLLIIQNTIDLLSSNNQFSIAYNDPNAQLFDVVSDILSKRTSVDLYRNELRKHDS